MSPATAAPPTIDIPLGPWKGTKRSVQPDEVGLEYIARGRDFLYNPVTGGMKRRSGQTIKFDTHGAVVGLLPAEWGGKCREFVEFISAAISDGVPTLGALVTKETLADSVNLEDGRFGTFYVRNQVANENYTLGSEYSAGTYPAPGTTQTYRVVPIWYDSGAGGITRGPAEFQRRFFCTGSRKALKVGNWWYFPNKNGVPIRWLDNVEGTESAAILATGDVADTATTGFFQGVAENGKWGMGLTPGTSAYGMLNTIDSTADHGFIFVNQWAAINNAVDGSVTTPALSSSLTRWRLRFRVQLNTSTSGAYTGNHYFEATIVLSNGTGYRADQVRMDSLNQISATGYGQGVFQYITLDIDTATATTTGGLTANSVRLEFNHLGVAFNPCFCIDYMEIVSVGGSVGEAIRVIPTGPLPPVHAGSLAAVNQIESSARIVYPTSDETSSSNWVKSSDGLVGNLHTMIDETPASDTDYIGTGNDNTNTECELKLDAMGYDPGSDSSVVLRFRAMRGGTDTGHIRMRLVVGTTIISTNNYTPPTYFYDLARTLTPTEISTITSTGSGWADLRVRFQKFTNSGQTAFCRVSACSLGHTASDTVATTGGWKGSDRFYYSVAYVFEDGSTWMHTVPRGPNATLGDSGYNLFTVDAGNPTANYQLIRWSNIPIGPHGVVARRLYRTTKIDSSTQSTLTLSPHDLRLVWTIQDNTTTTYDDFFADDDALDLTLKLNAGIPHEDHAMPHACRYIWAGDSRVCIAYGTQNPCAIEFAPVGYTAAYDRNVADTSSTLYGSEAFYYRVTTTALELYSDSGAALGTVDSYTLASHTLESLVDAINATTVTSNAKMWRAQLAPGANANAAATSLCPTTRTITGVLAAGQALTKAAGGLSVVPVGAWIQGTGVTDGAYVSEIVSDTELTFVGTIAAGTQDRLFNSPTGDNPTGTPDEYDGYIRALGNCLPSFLYFTTTYLATYPTLKGTVWMTEGSPLRPKACANSWVTRSANRFDPSDGRAGICMGGGAVDNGFVVARSGKVTAIRNRPDTGSGVDSEYKEEELDGTSGCVAWQSVCVGNRQVFMVQPEGVFAYDLERKMLLSEAIWRPPTSHALTGVGDFDYIMPKVVAATAADTDAYDIHAEVMRDTLFINYTATSGTHPNRQIRYDFSAGRDGSGLEALVRQDDLIDNSDPMNPRIVARRGELYGWSPPLVFPIAPTCMVEGRRTDGTHLYGWNEENLGTTGDGRIDEFETSDTDNGSAIASASVGTPWIQMGTDHLSGQSILVDHLDGTSPTLSLKFYRSFASDTYTMTPTARATLVTPPDVKMLALGARAPAKSCYVEYLQSAGGASELRRMVLRVFRLPILGRGPSFG